MHTSPHSFRFAALAAALLLASCGKPETITAGPPDDMKNQLANAKPVELPPAMEASKSYRCKDNSVVFIDWFAGGKQAIVRAKRDASPTTLKSDEAGKTLTAEGYALDGSSKDSTIEIAQPDKPKQSCKA
jgi:hypothetical protein